MDKGKNRDWGYASCDEDDNLTYTSYENNGSVNRYSDNGDGGHGHDHWDSKDDYNLGNDSDAGRSESNDSKNPSTGEVQDNGGCYLTSSCINYFKNNFDDNCYELKTLRWFRDNFVLKEDIEHYNKTAPIIVFAINNSPNSNALYNYIYDNIISVCVTAIENGNYEFAYKRYKSSILELEETFARPVLEKKLIKTLRKINI